MDSFGPLAALVGAALATCILVLITASEPALAAFPGENGKIVYPSYDGNDYAIYTISPNGGSPTKVIDNTADEGDPSFSPDGQKITYVNYDGSDYEIYSIPTGGGTPTNVTDNSTSGEGFPSFSPDGQKIVYRAYDDIKHEDSDYEIYTIPSGGGTPTQVTDNTTYDDHPSFSPDGQMIAYLHEEGNELDIDGEIYIIPSDGGTPTKVTDDPTTDDYRPDWGVLPDTTPPTVASVKPADQKTRVRRGTSVTATFSEKMLPSTLDESSVELFNLTAGSKVDAAVTYDEASKKVTLDPSVKLAKQTKYKAVITTTVTDMAGNPLKRQKGWTFTTGRK